MWTMGAETNLFQFRHVSVIIFQRQMVALNVSYGLHADLDYPANKADSGEFKHSSDETRRREKPLVHEDRKIGSRC